VMPMIIAATQDPHPDVRACACFALGQACMYLAPEVVSFHGTVIPACLQVLSQPDVSQKLLACYVLESFLEFLQPDQVRPYTQALLHGLGTVVSVDHLRVKQIAIGALGSLAAGAEDEFAPHAEGMMNLIGPMLFLTAPGTVRLRGVALLTAGRVCFAVGADIFAPYLDECMRSCNEGIAMENDEIEYELKESAHVFFFEAARTFERRFAPYVPGVVEAVRTAAHQPEIIVSRGKTEQFEALEFSDEESDDDDDDENGLADGVEGEELGGGGNTVNLKDVVGKKPKIRAIEDQAFITYKASAVQCMGGLAENCPEAIAPHANLLIATYQMLKDSVYPVVKGETYTAWALTIGALADAMGIAERFGPGEAMGIPDDLRVLVDQVVYLAVEAMALDDNRKIVSKAIMAMQIIAVKLGIAGLQSHMDDVMKAVLQLVRLKAPCQEKLDDDAEDPEMDIDADNVILDATCDLIGSLGRCMGPLFAQYFDTIVQHMQRFIRPESSHHDRAMLFGCYGEALEHMGETAFRYANVILPQLQAGLEDSMVGTRRNASYAAGVLASCSGAPLAPHYPDLLRWLAPVCRRAASDDPTSDGADTDNALSAVSRMIHAVPQAVPLEHVLPVFLEALPLQSDMEEAERVYACVCSLLAAENPAMESNLPRALLGLALALQPTHKANDDVKENVRQCLAQIAAQPHRQARVREAVGVIPDPTARATLAAVMGLA